MRATVPSAISRASSVRVALLFLLIIMCASCREPANSTQRANASPAGSSSAAVRNSNVVIRSVQVSPKLPAYRFVLTRDPAASDTPQDMQHVGRIDISAGNSPKVIQSIDVEGTDPHWFQGSFHTLDINFDGCQDFAVLYQVGGKWTSDSYWLFDPGSGRYITNALTAELKELMPLDLKLDAQKKEIRISFFTGPCPSSFEIYRIENGHLVLMESEIHSPREPGRCLVEKRKRINGKLTLIEVSDLKHEVSP